MDVGGGVITGTVLAGGEITGTVTPGGTINGSVTSGGIGPPGPTGPQGATGATGATGPQGPTGDIAGYFNVVSYGAIGNGIADDTAAIGRAITAAIAAGGGTVFLPTGTYLTSSALVPATGISLLGEGSEASVINQSSTTADGIDANDAASVSIQGLLIEGPGSGSGVGIAMGWTSAGNVPFLDFKDVKVHNFGSDGIAIETPIVSTFNNVVSKGNGGYGFNFYHAGTSCTFISCWAEDNVQAGYHFYESIYMTLIGCAADGNGMGYLVENAQSVHFAGCGAESQLVGSGDWDGTSFKISNSSACGLYNCYVGVNPAVGVWVTNGSIATEIFGVADNSPGGTATAFVKTDVSTNTTLSDVHNTTSNSYSAGTVTVLNDGANGMLTKQMTVKDASGSMILTAASDGAGGNYSIQADTTGILDIFGQGGQTLNVNLLDGYLQLSALTATTVPYLDGNSRFASSSVTPTELGYVHGVTSAIQTQFGLKAPLASPALTGTPTAPTATVGTNTTQIATTAFVLANVGTGMTNPMTTAGDIIVGGTSGTPARLAIGSSTSVLMGGTTPVWTSATGTGTPVLAGSPTLVTPVLGAATATSLNGLTVSTTTGTLTLVNGSSLITAGANSLTLSTTGTTNATFPNGTFTLAGISSTQTLTNKTITGLKLTAGTTTVAPLTIASGTNLSAAVSGSIEYDGTSLTYTDSTPTRQTLVTTGKTQTLSNKTLSGNTAVTLISGSGTLTLNTTGTVTLPNTTDTLVGKATTDTLTNKTIDAQGTGNSITNVASLSVSRQNDTTNNTVTATRIESGWGVFAQGAASNKSETVTFKTAFTSIPIVMISYGGDQTGGTIALGNGGNTEKGPVAIKAYGESTTAFTAHAHTTDGTSWSATANVYYKWYAIGA